MKILFISEYFPASADMDIRGGVENRTANLAHYLAKKHQVYVIASCEMSQPVLQRLANVTVYRVGWPRVYGRTNIFSRLVFIMTAIWRGLFIDCDLVEGTGFFGWLPAWVVSVLKQKPRILFVADVVENYTQGVASSMRKLLKLYEKFILSRYWHSIICISEMVKQAVVSRYQPKSRIEVIYCGVTVDRIIKIKVRKIPHQIYCVARLVPYKRVGDLIDALPFLKSKLADLSCVIVGDGEQFRQLVQQVKKLHLTQTVRFKGHISKQEDMFRCLKTAAVFCLPSVVEGFGITTIEALAAGVPGVLADIPVNREITQGKGVIYFKPQDSRDLALKLEQILTKARLYRQLVTKGKKQALQFDVQYTHAKTEQLYQSVCID